jgi:hypothetical protein
LSSDTVANINLGNISLTGSGDTVNVNLTIYADGLNSHISVGDIELTGNISTDLTASETVIWASIHASSGLDLVDIGDVTIDLNGGLSALGNIGISGIAWDQDRDLFLNGSGSVILDLAFDNPDSMIFQGIHDENAGMLNVNWYETPSMAGFSPSGNVGVDDATTIYSYDNDGTISFNYDYATNTTFTNLNNVQSDASDLWTDLSMALQSYNYAFEAYDEINGGVDINNDGTLSGNVGVLAWSSLMDGQMQGIVFFDGITSLDYGDINHIVT